MTIYAGLTEEEANSALCEWIKERCPETDIEVWFNVRRIYFQIGGPYNVGFEKEGLFTESHSAIHRLIDTLDETEKERYKTALMILMERPTLVLALGRAVFATPAQKAIAALDALGLGKEQLQS